MSNSKEIAEITTPVHKNLASIGGPGIPEIIPQSMDEVWRFAQMVARSGLLPKGIKTPEQVWTQIITGYDLGLKPMVAINNIAVINGRPSVGGDLALAILLTSGLLLDHDEWIEGEGDDRVGVCKVERKGLKAIERRFSVKNAIQAGLWQTKAMIRKDYWDKREEKYKPGQFDVPNDSPWWRYQDRMLMMRARGFAFRDRFTDVLKGMHLTEEMEGHRDEVPEVQISGPTPPPADTMDVSTEMPKVENRQEATVSHAGGPSAPPEVEEADIVEGEQRAELRAGEMPGAGDPQDSRENAGIAEGEQDSQHGPFDFATWIQEVRDLVASCTTAQDIDNAADMFSSTAEEDCTRTQREEFDEVIGTAHTRLEQALAAGAVDRPEETKPATTMLEDDDEEEKPAQTNPGEQYEIEIDIVMSDPTVTSLALTELWNNGKLHRKDLVAKGHWSVDAREALKTAVGAAIASKAEAEKWAHQPAANSPEIPEGSTSEESSGDPKAAFTDTLRARLEACTTPDEVSALSTETLPYRNEIGDPTHLKLWRTMVTKRRDALT